MAEKIAYGHDSWNVDVKGKTVQAAIDQYKVAFNLPSNARIEVNGEAVSSNYILKDGDAVEVVRETGVKGLLFVV